MKNIIFIYCLSLLLNSCNKLEDYHEYYDKENKNLRIEGKFDKVSGLEEGDWKYYDSLGHLTEYGTIQNGFLVDTWHYKNNILKEISINWNVYYDSINNIKCNYPKDFNIVKNADFLFAASNKDSVNKINLLINTVQLQPEETSEMYKNTIIASAKETYSITSYKCQYQKTANGEEYFYFEFPVDGKGKIFHIFKNNKQNLITEINCFASSDNIEMGYRVFTGVLLHTFLKNVRFFSPLTKIEKIIVCD